MPGIVGFTAPPGWSDEKADAALLKMRDALQYHEKHRPRACFSFPGVRGSCVSTNPHQEQVFSTEDLTVWMDGEYRIGDESAGIPGAEAASGPALLHALFRTGDYLSALATLDGIYAAAVYDARHRKIHLVSDRYGLRQLCWTRRGDALAWATESKAAAPARVQSRPRPPVPGSLSRHRLPHGKPYLDGKRRASGAGNLPDLGPPRPDDTGTALLGLE